MRLLDDLQEIKTQQTNRYKSGVESERVKQHLSDHLRYIEEEMGEVMRQIRQVIDGDEQLSHHFTLLISIKGVGAITAALFLAENIASFRSVRAVTAHAGLNPKSFTSGYPVARPPRLSKIGSARFTQGAYYFLHSRLCSGIPVSKHLATTSNGANPAWSSLGRRCVNS